ncbi:MAG: hypothetical protein WBJ68_01955 [Candidatus Dechloromonas phosphoritropha]
MGEWSEYFEDFPDEDPGNYVGVRFDPAGAKAQREQKSRVAEAQAKLDAEIASIVAKHKKKK